ncbi:MAG: sigma-70 family RNA polymerase sigma factor [Gemmatimonadetes bacterium]|nr:sigma-70 family RNA polymerase sigma factor [Gemmatimonadota bacterium]
MSTVSETEITRLLREASSGDRASLDRLFPVVYEELRRIARDRMRGERPGHTLQPTALVHEAYARLLDLNRLDWKNRAHFFGVAAGIIRRVLVDHARKRGAEKRGGDRDRVELEHANLAAPSGTDAVDVLALHRALERLEATEPDKARVVELRFFAGLTTEEAAEVMGVTSRTVERHWRYARAWLLTALEGPDPEASP